MNHIFKCYKLFGILSFSSVLASYITLSWMSSSSLLFCVSCCWVAKLSIELLEILWGGGERQNLQKTMIFVCFSNKWTETRFFAQKWFQPFKFQISPPPCVHHPNTLRNVDPSIIFSLLVSDSFSFKYLSIEICNV